MICKDCRDQVHGSCRGETWCDCQHRRLFTEEEYQQALTDMAEIRRQREERRAQEDRLGDHGPEL